MIKNTQTNLYETSDGAKFLTENMAIEHEEKLLNLKKQERIKKLKERLLKIFPQRILYAKMDSEKKEGTFNFYYDPEDQKKVDKAYRDYYRIGKRSILNYTKREKPQWL